MQHSGLINLGIVIILATNSRLILENITKYGLRATPLTWLQRAISVSTSSNRHTLVGFIGLGCCILAAWAIEFLGKRRLQCARHSLYLSCTFHSAFCMHLFEVVHTDCWCSLCCAAEAFVPVLDSLAPSGSLLPPSAPSQGGAETKARSGHGLGPD